MNNGDGQALCPFFVRDRGLVRSSKKHCVNCEGCTLKFPNIVSKRMFVYKLCAHPEGYKNCMMYKALYDYYNRLYSNEGKE